jgi:hypothetical protein
MTDSNDEATKVFAVEVVCPLVGTELEFLKVTLEYGPEGSPEAQTVILLDKTSRFVTWPWNAEVGSRYRYAYEGAYKAEPEVRAKSFRFSKGFQQSETRPLVILPERHLLFVGIFLVANPAVSRVEVELGYDDEVNGLRFRDSRVFDETHKSDGWALLLADPNRREYWYQARFRLVNGATLMAPQQTTETRMLFLDCAARRLSVVFISMPSPHAVAYIVDVEIQDPAIASNSVVLRLRADQVEIREESVLISDSAAAVVRYRVAIERPRGIVEMGEYQTTTEKAFYVGEPT